MATYRKSMEMVPDESGIAIPSVTVTVYEAGTTYKINLFSAKSGLTFSGSGLDDIVLGNLFAGSADASYVVKIDAEGAPDQFTWSNDGEATWEATGVSIVVTTDTLASNAAANQADVVVSDSTGFSAGDRIYIKDDNGYEFAEIDSIVTNGNDTITLTANLVNAYTTAASATIQLMQQLDDSVDICFLATTGHTLNDKWTSTARPNPYTAESSGLSYFFSDADAFPEVTIMYEKAGFDFTDANTGSAYTPIPGGGGGNVDGPSSTTDNAVARWDGTDGLSIQDSAVIIADTTGNMTGVGALTIGDVLTFSDGGTIDNTDADTLTLTETSVAIVGKYVFGGVTDWGTGATGTLIDGTGYDWVGQTVGRINSNLNSTAAAAAYHAITVTANQTSSNSVFGTWTELYIANSVDLSGSDNYSSVWGQFEAGTGVTLSDTGCFTAGGYFNVKAGSTLTVAAGHSLNGVRAQIEVAAITNNGTTAAFECLKNGGVDWEYGLYLADTGIDLRLSSGAYIQTGSADPNGSVTGVDGSIYQRTGTTSDATILYVCTGTTNWSAVIAGGGNVSNVGTPVDNQIAVWKTATTIEGDTKLTWDAAILTVTGNLGVDGTTVVLDGSTSVRGISAGFTSLESPANRLGLNATEYMQIATTVTTGITTITHTGSAPAVTWTADSLSFVGNFDSNGDTAVLDGSTYAKLLSAGYVGLESTDIRIGYSDHYTKFVVADTTGNLTITHVGGNTDLVTWTAAGGFAFVGDFSADGTTMIIDGSTSFRGVSAGFTSLESPVNRLGLNATEYIQFATTVTTGALAITHTGSVPDVTWAADSLAFTGNFSSDGTTAVLDGSTSVRLLSAAFVIMESPANRFGLNSTEYMQIATTATSGITAITHTGNAVTVDWTAPIFTFTNATSMNAFTPSWVMGYDVGAAMTIATTDTTGAIAITHAGSGTAVTWAAASMTLTTTFEVVGASTFDGITGVGDLSIDGALALIDGSTSVRNVSAALVSLEAPDIRFGFDSSDYMKIAVAETTGVTAITHTGSGPTVTWTANSFDFVGPISLDGLTISGDTDSAGKLDFQYNPAAGSSTGHIIKGTLTTATGYDGTTAGLIVKEYFADNACTVTGGELTGLYVNVKQLAVLTGGAKSSLISAHNYGSGGDYQSIDYGIILYGDLTAGFELSGGTSAYGIKMGNQTISTADIQLSSGALIQTGSADPNGSVTGVDGSLYCRTGTAAASTVAYVCTGATTWAALGASGSGVTKVGTPVDNEIGVWTGDGTLEGDTNFQWDGAGFTVLGTMFIKEQAAAAADKAGYMQLWAKTGTPCTLWMTDEDGTDTEIGSGGGGADILEIQVFL